MGSQARGNVSRDENGEFVPKYSKYDALHYIKNTDELIVTTDVADEIGCSYRTAYGYLTELESDGKIQREKKGTTSFWTEA